jgi:hypothetical protein
MTTSGHPIGWSRSTSMDSWLPCISLLRDGLESLPGGETRVIFWRGHCPLLESLRHVAGSLISGVLERRSRREYE